MPRWLRLALITALVLGALTAAAYWAALRTLKAQVVQQLGPQGEYAAIDVTLHTIVIEGLRIRADRSLDAGERWPSDDELRAERVVIEPDLRSLLTDNILIRRVSFEGAYLPIMRLSGQLRFLPTLFEGRRRARPARGEPEGLPPKKYVVISKVDIADGQIDFFDATVSRKPYRIPLREVSGTVSNVKLPTLDEAATLDLQAVTTANGHRGTVALKGNIVPRTRDSRLSLKLDGVDLRLLQPYFVRRTPAQIEAGTLDMQLESTVRDHILNAPGTLVLHDLKMGGGFEFGSLSRKLALGILKDDQDRIALDFTLSGDIRKPQFSLNEELYVRVGTALASSLGVSIENLGKGAVEIGEGIGSFLHKIVE